MNNNIIISGKEFRRKKRPLYVFLSPDVEERFRKFIALKYQRAEKGQISHEVELAIKNHLAVHNTQQNTQSTSSGNRIFNISQVMEQIHQYFIESGLYDEAPTLIPDKHLDQAIANIRGSDKRTIRRWKTLLVEYGHIKQTGIKQYQIL